MTSIIGRNERDDRRGNRTCAALRLATACVLSCALLVLPGAPTAHAAVPQADFYLADMNTASGGFSEGTLSINGTTYVHGLYDYDYGSGSGSAEWDLGRTCSSLTAVLGPGDNSTVGSSVQYEISFDGALQQTQVVGFGQSVPLNMSVANVLRLGIVVSIVDDGSANSSIVYMDLGDPKVVCESDSYVGRLAGANRISTAVATSADAFANDSASAVVLTRSDSYADALAGTPLAIQKGGPLLLTPTSVLDGVTSAEIDRVLPSGGTVYVLGGTAAIGDGVVSTLERRGYHVTRLAGGNRFATAVVIAEQGLGSPSTALLATGMAFWDALAAGAASPGAAGAAVLLTNGTSMPPETSSYLSRHSPTRFAIGDDAISADPSATPVGGSDHVETALAVANQFFPSPQFVGVAGDGNFPDALTGGAHAGALGGPLLWTYQDQLPSDVYYYLQSNGGAIDAAFVYGGTAAVSDSVVSSIRSLI